MNEDELIFRIKSNKITKSKAIILISDFLSITKEEAKEIYNERLGSCATWQKIIEMI